MYQIPFRFNLENLFPDANQPFKKRYSCYSVSFFPGNERDDVEKGGKIIMPPSALEILTRYNNFQYPMMFKLTNEHSNRITHCGVLEFVADEERVYIPYWMMCNLQLSEGDQVVIENVVLPTGTYSKFQPHTSDFLDISNPKAVLENSLRNFACLSKGDVIAINYNNKVYNLSVLETKPKDAINIIECDMNVEFAPPKDYKEKSEEKLEEQDLAKLMPPPKGFVAFSGGGSRLDGKARKPDQISEPKVEYKRGIPDYNYKTGTIKFIRTPKPIDPKLEGDKEDFVPFSGHGTNLRDPRLPIPQRSEDGFVAFSGHGTSLRDPTTESADLAAW